MKRFSFAWMFGLMLVILSSALAQNAPIVTPGARVAVVGDSITEQKIYSRNIEMYLMVCQPQLQAQVMQFGWGGERASGCAGRMANDILPFKPTVVTLCYGMNDGSYRPYEEGIGKGYEMPLRDSVTRFKAAGTTVVVGSPGAVDSKTFNRASATPDVYNANLGELTKIAQRVATDLQMPFADVHTPLMTAIAQAKAAFGADYQVCGGDGVHPGPNGHLVMAYAFLKAMGFDGDLGTITIDMNGNATAVNGHKVLVSKPGQAEIESSRYPFCFFGDEKSFGGNRSILPYVPFNNDLNRLTLVVKNLKGARAKVTWGTASKEFSRADLEKGINLAAEFIDNPFVAPFQQVDRIVNDKQNYETFMIKNEITQIPYLKRQLGDNAELNAATEALSKQLWAKENGYVAQLRAAIVPVKHTITVESIAQ